MEQMDKQQVLHSLSMTDCIRLMRTVLREHAQGKGQQYLRTVTCLPGNDLFGFMPAHLGTGDYFGAKVITVFPGNHQVGLPSHQGSVLLFDAQHGTLQFMADGDAITQIRTGAVSAVATDLLAQPGAGRLALLGAGAQGRSHLEAIALIRRLTDVAVWDARPENAQKFAAEMAKSTGCPIRICSSAEEAARDADIICTLTPSPTPILGKRLGSAGRSHQCGGGLFRNHPGIKLCFSRPLPPVWRQHRIGGKRKRRLFDSFIRRRDSKRASAGHHRAAFVRRDYRPHIGAGRDGFQRAGPCHRGYCLCQIPLSCRKRRKLA